MPNARPWRTSRSSSSAASCASLSSSTKNSWNSSTISRIRGIVSSGLRGAIAGQVLHARRRGTARRARFSSPSSRCSTLRPNSRSLSIATTRACGSRCVGVGLELDALLEVDQVQLDLVRAVRQREVRDQRVQQRRFAGAGLAGDQHVLRGALAERRTLQLRRPGAADGHVEALRGASPSRPRPASGRCTRTAPRRGWRPCSPSPTRCTSCAIASRRRAARRASAGTGRESGSFQTNAPSFQAEVERSRLRGRRG